MWKYNVLNAQVRAPTPGVPLVAFTLKAEKRTHGYNEFDIADRLRQFGWVVPVRARTFAPTTLLDSLESGMFFRLHNVLWMSGPKSSPTPGGSPGFW